VKEDRACDEHCVSISIGFDSRFRNLVYDSLMDGSADTEQSWSKTLFGNQHMLRVTSSIARGSADFTSPQLERSTGLGASSVHRLVSALCQVGLVSRIPRSAGERVQHYRRERLSFWRAMEQLRDRAHSESPAVADAHTRSGL